MKIGQTKRTGSPFSKRKPAAYQIFRVGRGQEKRSFGWFRPLLGGVIGGGLALGIYTFTPLGDHQTQDTSNTAPAQETSSVTAKQTSSDSGSSKSANSSSANSSSISNMVEDISPAIVGITNLQKQQSSSDLFGFGSSSDSNSNSSGEDAETGSGSGVILRKQTAKRISLRITTWSKAPLPLKCHYMTAPM